MRRTILLAAFGALAACTSRGTDDSSLYAPLPALPDAPYKLPTGGPDSISIAIMDCKMPGCPIVNVLLDPDNYWQRTSNDGAYSGIAPGDLYASMQAAFEDQGFDDVASVLDITKDNPAACPQYLQRGLVYYIYLGRDGKPGQRITYDTGCSGSLDARRAEFVTEALAEMTDLTHIIDGAVTLEDDMGDEE